MSKKTRLKCQPHPPTSSSKYKFSKSCISFESSSLSLPQPRSLVVLYHTLHHVTIHILLFCSMFHDNKVRRTAEVRLNSCFLGWKFQALRAICLYVHWCIWEPSIRLLALQLLGPSQPSLPPSRLPASLPACLLACLDGFSQPQPQYNESSFFTLCHTEWADLIKSWALIMLGRGVEFQW